MGKEIIETIFNRYLCNYCSTKLNNNEMPRVSVINGCDAGKFPQEISKLNAFSLLFIELASNFPTHFKLGPTYSKIPENQKMVGVRENSIQLPIPIQNTIDELESNLANNRLLDINDINKHLIIYNKRNSNKETVFKNLVNVHNIKDALIWLKSHNRHYAHISIPADPHELLPAQNVAIINEHIDDTNNYTDTVSILDSLTEMLTQDLSDSEFDEIEMLTQDVYYDSECDQVVTLDEYCDREYEEMVTLDEYCDSECEEMVTLDVYCESDIQCGVYDNNSCIANSGGTLVTQDEYIASSDEAVNIGNSNVDPFRCDTVYEDISCRNVNSIKVNNSTVKLSKMSKEFDISKPTDAKLIEKLSDIELSYLIQQYTVTAANTVSDNPDPETFDTLYNFLKIKDAPISSEHSNLDMYCFPDLFPFGVGGGRKEEREEPAQPLRYEKTRLLSSNAQFRRNFQYLFYLLQENERRKINQGLFPSVNNVLGLSDISSEKLLQMLENNDESINRNLSRVLSKIPNTPQYWSSQRNRLEAQIEKFGPPSLFITFSPAEYDWVDAYEYLKNHNLDLPNVESLLPAQLFALDPVLTSMFIRNKFAALLEFIKRSNVLGNIKSYWVRDEYQGRGTCHFHCFFWVEGAPILGKSSDEDIAEFVNGSITCRLPDAHKEPSLHNNVLKYQTHKCGKYCKRIVKNKSSGRFTSTCRFSFPRKSSKEFVLHDVVSSIVGRHTNNFKKRLYDLPRNINETWINDYNPDLLLLWGGNMDIQIVSEYTYSICNYVTKYITKSEKSNIENLEFAGNDQSPYQKAAKFAYGLLRMRKLGAHEAADRILQNSGELWRSSETYLFIPTTFPKYRTDGLKVCMNLWREFDYEELTINQRQSGESNNAWKQLLYRARLGILSCNDHCLLSNRLVPLENVADDTHRPIDRAVEHFVKLRSIEPSAVCLLPTRNMVDELNSKVMSKLNRSVIEISALDEIDCKIKRISKNAEEAVKQLDRLDDARQTGGLEKVLKLANGARVMLPKNLDVTKGLVNGSMGTLVDVVYAKQETIQLLKIKFDLYSSVIDIARDTRKIQIYSNAYLYRKQFPLTIAYSMTIHKSQGLSLKCVLADLGKSVFSPGMAYVCLSRVTSVDGLHLLNLSVPKIKVSKSAIKEYVRLRGKAFNEMGVKIKYNLKDVERVWYTTGVKRKCINSISSQTIHGIPEVKKVMREHTSNQPYSNELNYIKDLKCYVLHSLLHVIIIIHYVTDVNYDLVYGDCIKTVMFDDVRFHGSSELTEIIEELYPDTDNRLNRHNQAQWLSEKTVSCYCTYLKTVTDAKVFSFSSYFSSIFDRIGDVSTDNANSLEDPAIPTACHSFIMQALRCVMSDVHLMQPNELTNMSYSQKIRHIMLSNGDPLDHDYILFPINNGHHWYMLFIDNRSNHKKCIYLDSGSSGKRCKRDRECNKAIKIINYYREYLNLLLQGNNQSINSLAISPLTHPMDYELTSNMQENSHDCGPFTLMNAEILLRNGNINTLLTTVMPLLRIYIMYNLICKLRGIRLRS